MRAFIIIIAFLVISCGTHEIMKPTLSEEPEMFLSDSRRALDRRAEISGFGPLGSRTTADGDLDLRVWVAGGFSATRGFILQKEGGAWNAYYLPPVGKDASSTSATSKLTEKVSDWELFFKDLEASGVLSEPTHEQISGLRRYEDGQTVTIQLQQSGRIVEYSVTEPCAQDNSFAENVCRVLIRFKKDLEIQLASFPSP